MSGADVASDVLRPDPGLRAPKRPLPLVFDRLG